jgi:hypothetical protein
LPNDEKQHLGSNSTVTLIGMSLGGQVNNGHTEQACEFLDIDMPVLSWPDDETKFFLALE